MRRAVLLHALLPLALAAAPASAASLRSCDTFEAGAQFLILPADEGVRSYANGAISLLHLDTDGEPACCSSHLLVRHPDPSAPFQACTLISHEGEMGFQWLFLSEAEARYDPATGLSVGSPAFLYGETAPRPARLTITVNQAQGTVRAENALR
ncbi:hypothetical protein [Litorisediminicola beolgyonensis]|uniref:Lipoprotein n=1 Tax=Litorisediminicola beolgyonensis TaxID=1173614 RepID=A0ABW3ZHV1_9RHOB